MHRPVLCAILHEILLDERDRKGSVKEEVRIL
jgi:hypothetical protein